MNYTPYNWVILKIRDGDVRVIYKVLASWKDGYLDQDHWRLNSGITNVKKKGGYYHFSGYSGSMYQCHENVEGLSSLTSSVYLRLKKAPVNEMVEVIPVEQFMKEFAKWIT